MSTNTKRLKLLTPIKKFEKKNIEDLTNSAKHNFFINMCKEHKGKHVKIVYDDGSQGRLFNIDQKLYQMFPSAKSRGFKLETRDLANAKSAIIPLTLTEEQKAEDARITQTNLVHKLKNEARLATFTNSLIEKILAADENLSLYKNNISTSNKIEGDFINVKTVARILGWEKESFLKALKEKTNFTSSRRPWWL
ncbi:hypothetical protein I3271_00915 [Photobacterium leiognathi]|uniref:hypothetical protein n=1 Tax=Photobacterium leiognathi TaxID=553611 RepID=UPI001EDE2244|nr:hypothetical protein [Photobacterium leiognathi]MCG3883243.1 hypothetical protein [Photobacterium leiognathi]